MFKVISKGKNRYTGYKVTIDFTCVHEAIKEKNKLNREFEDWEHTVEVYSNDKE